MGAKRNWKLLGSSYICGLINDPEAFMTPIDVWLAMTGKPPIHDFQENERIRWGNYLELGIIKSFIDDFALDPNELEINRTFVSKKNDNYCSTPDGVCLDKKLLLEVKNVALDKKYRWFDGVPDLYFAQCQWHMKIVSEYADITECHVRVLFGGNQAESYIINKDNEFIKQLTIIADDFIENYVITGLEPPVDCSREYSEYLAIKYPLAPTNKIKKDADPQAEELIEKWIKKKFEAKRIDSEIQLIKNQIEELICKKGIYGFTSLLGSVARYKVKGKVKKTDILKDLCEEDEKLKSKVDDMSKDEKYIGKDYFVTNLYPKKGE